MGPERHVDGVASHVAQRAGAEIKPAAPAERMIDVFLVGPFLGRSQPDVPAETFGDGIFARWPRDALRPGDLRVVTDEAGIQLDESRGLLRRLGEEVVGAQLGEVRPVVFPYAQELIGVRHGRQVADRALVEDGAARLLRARQRRCTPGEQVLHAPGAKVSDAVTLAHADVRCGIVASTKGDEPHANSYCPVQGIEAFCQPHLWEEIMKAASFALALLFSNLSFIQPIQGRFPKKVALKIFQSRPGELTEAEWSG